MLSFDSDVSPPTTTKSSITNKYVYYKCTRTCFCVQHADTNNFYTRPISIMASRLRGYNSNVILGGPYRIYYKHFEINPRNTYSWKGPELSPWKVYRCKFSLLCIYQGARKDWHTYIESAIQPRTTQPYQVYILSESRSWQRYGRVEISQTPDRTRSSAVLRPRGLVTKQRRWTRPMGSRECMLDKCFRVPSVHSSSRYLAECTPACTETVWQL